MTLAEFNEKVPDMIDSFDETYDTILGKQGRYDNNVQALFDALMTTKKSKFNVAIAAELCTWEKGEEISFGDLKSTALEQYNNIST